MIELLYVVAALVLLFLAVSFWRYVIVHARIMSHAKEYLDRSVRMVDFQEVQGQVFAYDHEDGTFVAQGATKEECMQAAVLRWPYRLFLTDIGEKGRKEIFKDATEFAIKSTLGRSPAP